jgi:hypothetical protein
MKPNVDQIAQSIQTIANEMAKQAPGVWEGLVRYHRTTAITELVVSLVVFALSVFVVKNAVSLVRSEDDMGGGIAAGLILICVSAGLSGAVAHRLPDVVAQAVVPERAAALEIISRASGGAP